MILFSMFPSDNIVKEGTWNAVRQRKGLQAHRARTEGLISKTYVDVHICKYIYLGKNRFLFSQIESFSARHNFTTKHNLYAFAKCHITDSGMRP